MLPRPGAADGGGYKRKKSERRSRAITLVGLLERRTVVVDTELIRVNFIREESEPWSRASGGRTEGALRSNDCVRL